MQAIKARISSVPEGTAALFFIQVFATLGFAVLYSTLVLYTTRHLQFSVKEATAIMGVFGAFNYGLHLFGGEPGTRARIAHEIAHAAPHEIRREHADARVHHHGPTLGDDQRIDVHFADPGQFADHG